jgi:hypothetical protein
MKRIPGKKERKKEIWVKSRKRVKNEENPRKKE